MVISFNVGPETELEAAHMPGRFSVSSFVFIFGFGVLPLLPRQALFSYLPALATQETGMVALCHHTHLQFIFDHMSTRFQILDDCA